MKTQSTLALTIAIGVVACRSRPAVAPVPPPWFDQEIENLAQQSQPGSVREGEVYRGVTHEEDETIDWQVMLDSTKCYWFSGVGDQTVEELALYLFNPNDKRVESNRGKTSRNVLAHCPIVPGMYKLRAKPTEGAGHIAVGLYSKAAPARAAAPPPEEKPKETVKEPDLVAIADAEANQIAPGSKRVAVLSGSADVMDWFQALEPGNCYWMIAIGGTGVKEVSTYLWNQANKRVTENRADGPKAILGHCPTDAGMFRIQLKVTSGEGNYKVGVYAKPQGGKK